MNSKSVSEWLHERGFDETLVTSREGVNFTPSRQECSGPLVSAEALSLGKASVEERKAMELATNTQKASIVDAGAEKPPMPK